MAGKPNTSGGGCVSGIFYLIVIVYIIKYKCVILIAVAVAGMAVLVSRGMKKHEQDKMYYKENPTYTYRETEKNEEVNNNISRCENKSQDDKILDINGIALTHTTDNVKKINSKDKAEKGYDLNKFMIECSAYVEREAAMRQYEEYYNIKNAKEDKE